jgi:hypothetical protein
MKAKKKKVEKLSPKDLGVDITPRMEVGKHRTSGGRNAGGVLANLRGSKYR